MATLSEIATTDNPPRDERPPGRATLGDLLQAPALHGVEVVPKRADLGVRVEALAMVGDTTLPSVPYALLAGGMAPARVPAGCVAVIARSAPAGALSVPVALLPSDVTWVDALAGLATALGSGSGLAAASDARVIFRDLTLAGGGHAGLAAAAAKLLGAPVAILDEYLDGLATAGITERHEADLRRAVAAARGHGPASPIGVFLRDDLPGASRLEVRSGRDAAGLVVAWFEGSGSVAQHAVLEELHHAVLGERARDGVRAETEAQLRGDFIEELLAGDAISADSVVRRGRHLGADLSRGAVAVAGTLQDPHNLGRLITDPRLTRRFLQRARSVVAMNRQGALLDWREGHLLVLLPPIGEVEEGAETAVEHDAAQLGARLLAATRETVPGLALTLAFSRFTRDPARLGTAIDEARLAHAIGDRLGRLGDVVTFEETGAYKLLFRVLADRPEELTAFYTETLETVVRYDSDHQTDLVATLATYLENDGNLAGTAAKLFTHRHTVRYRLDRIAELSGLDISRSDDREMLSLGLKAMRLLGHPVPSAAATLADRARESA